MVPEIFLGAAQSGHMEDVGYDLYCKMLNDAINTLKGNKPMDDFETKVDLTVDAFVPPSYIKNEALKMDIYKRIAGIETMEEYEDMQDELLDRFGDIPNQVENLLQIVLLKNAAHQAYVTEISGHKNKIKLTMWKDAEVDVKEYQFLSASTKADLSLCLKTNRIFIFEPKPGTGTVIENARKLVESLSTLKDEE